jgi:hypothetical protein
MTSAEFRARCDWAAVRADVAEHRAECEMAVAQTTAEIRAACRPPRLREQEELASLQHAIDVDGWFLGVLDRQGL